VIEAVRATENDKTVFKLRGSLVAGCAAQLETATTAAGRACAFDFADVTIVNSVGFREWIAFLTRFGVNRSIVFRDCGYPILVMIAMFPAFLGGAVLESILLEVRCVDCRRSAMQRLTAAAYAASGLAAARKPSCDVCKRPGASVTALEEVEDCLDRIAWGREAEPSG